MNTAKTKFTSFFQGLKDTILAGYVSASMFIYGAAKFMQFGYRPYNDHQVSELTGMELMWAFYGYTLTYPIIVGFFEILGAFLLFFKKTRIVGALLLTTILVNIIIQDIIYGVLAGAIVSASIYQLIIFYFLFKSRKEIKAALVALASIKSPEKTWTQRVIHVGIAVLVTLLIKMSIGL